MTTFLLSLFFLKIITNINSNLTDDNWTQFTLFQEKFNKKYISLNDLQNRFEIFQSNMQLIHLHNSDLKQNFTMGINKFSDLTPYEFKTQFASGFTYSSKTIVKGTTCKSFSGTGKSVPTSIDWRNLNAVTSVKDQGYCGSCWTFSAAGAIEGAWAISKNQLVNLSEQQLVDCAGLKYGSMGCNGGQMDGAFNYAIDTGLCMDTSYPYVSGTTQTAGVCHSCLPVVKMSSCSDVKPNNQVALKEAVSLGPVSIAIDAETSYFQSYTSGILTNPSCGTTLDHGVLIVGYGEENGIKYWSVKNSWSSSWGEKGYVRILRSENVNDPGICGIGMQPSFPSV